MLLLGIPKCIVTTARKCKPKIKQSSELQCPSHTYEDNETSHESNFWQNIHIYTSIVTYLLNNIQNRFLWWCYFKNLASPISTRRQSDVVTTSVQRRIDVGFLLGHLYENNLCFKSSFFTILTTLTGEHMWRSIGKGVLNKTIDVKVQALLCLNFDVNRFVKYSFSYGTSHMRWVNSQYVTKHYIFKTLHNLSISSLNLMRKNSGMFFRQWR